MTKHPIFICTNCLSAMQESKKAPTCSFCKKKMVPQSEILDNWIETYSSRFIQLFNHLTPFYNYPVMIDEETASFDIEKFELDDDIYGLLNEIVDSKDKRLPLAVVLHTTGKYMDEYDWDDFEFSPPIDLLDPKIRIGFLFFLDFISLALTHTILRESRQNDTPALLSELYLAHQYFNHVLWNELGGKEELREIKARWPVVIHGFFENYIPPINAINTVWKEAEKYRKNP